MNPNAPSFTPFRCGGADNNQNDNDASTGPHRSFSPENKENEAPNNNNMNTNHAAPTNPPTAPARGRPTLLRSNNATPTNATSSVLRGGSPSPISPTASAAASTDLAAERERISLAVEAGQRGESWRGGGDYSHQHRDRSVSPPAASSMASLVGGYSGGLLRATSPSSTAMSEAGGMMMADNRSPSPANSVASIHSLRPPLATLYTAPSTAVATTAAATTASNAEQQQQYFRRPPPLAAAAPSSVSAVVAPSSSQHGVDEEHQQRVATACHHYQTPTTATGPSFATPSRHTNTTTNADDNADHATTPPHPSAKTPEGRGTSSTPPPSSTSRTAQSAAATTTTPSSSHLGVHNGMAVPMLTPTIIDGIKGKSPSLRIGGTPIVPSAASPSNIGHHQHVSSPAASSSAPTGSSATATAATQIPTSPHRFFFSRNTVTTSAALPPSAGPSSAAATPSRPLMMKQGTITAASATACITTTGNNTNSTSAGSDPLLVISSTPFQPLSVRVGGAMTATSSCAASPIVCSRRAASPTNNRASSPKGLSSAAAAAATGSSSSPPPASSSSAVAKRLHVGVGATNARFASLNSLPFTAAITPARKQREEQHQQQQPAADAVSNNTNNTLAAMGISEEEEALLNAITSNYHANTNNQKTAVPASSMGAASSPVGASPATDGKRRNDQREKQITYGYNTEGYKNMLRLVDHDPRLCSGGVLPIPPPSPSLKTSKRTWDILIRKWRRALHMFDFVFIDGSEDEQTTTREEVLEQQRLKWVSPIHHIVKENTNAAAASPAKTSATVTEINTYAAAVPTAVPIITTGPRLFLSRELLLSRRNAPSVPKKIPVEESLKHLLKSPDCYEPVTSVIPEAMLYHSKGTAFTANDVGFKIVIAPSTVAGPYASARSPSPEVPDFAPSQLAATMNNNNSNAVPSSPIRGGGGEGGSVAAAAAATSGANASSHTISTTAAAARGKTTATSVLNANASPFSVPPPLPSPVVGRGRNNNNSANQHTVTVKPTPFRCQLSSSPSPSALSVSPAMSVVVAVGSANASPMVGGSTFNNHYHQQRRQQQYVGGGNTATNTSFSPSPFGMVLRCDDHSGIANTQQQPSPSVASPSSLLMTTAGADTNTTTATATSTSHDTTNHTISHSVRSANADEEDDHDDEVRARGDNIIASVIKQHHSDPTRTGGDGEESASADQKSTQRQLMSEYE